MLNDTDRKFCTQKCLICFFRPSPEELCQLVVHQLVSLLLSIRMSSTFRKKYGRLKSCNRPQIVLSRVQIQMLNDTDRKFCTQKCLICFFHPSPEELCQLVVHQLVSLCLALECNQHLKKIW